MEYQKKLLHNIPNQPNKFRTKKWFEIKDDLRGMYNTNSQIKFKTLILNSQLCDYSDEYMVVRASVTAPNTGTQASLNNRKNIIIKNCARSWISEINKTQIDDAKYIDVLMSMFNLTEHSNNY